MTAFLSSLVAAFTNLRSNVLQTLLSMLGVIIGVAALVGMLSMIDGLEQLAHKQLSSKTALENMGISARTTQEIDGVRVAREQVATLDVAVLRDLLSDLPQEAKGQLSVGGTTLVQVDTARIGITYRAVTLPLLDRSFELLAGTWSALDTSTTPQGSSPILINYPLARRLVAPDTNAAAALGMQFDFLGGRTEVVGVAEPSDDNKPNAILLPHHRLWAHPAAQQDAAQLALAFDSVEEVLAGRAFVEDWMAQRFADLPDPVAISTYTGYLEDIQDAFLVFRLVMGFIIGIAVVVGGVGIMNVLVMSVVERTSEIGIRKALGATRRAIQGQFLAESLVLSVVGSVFGTALGLGLSLLVGPIVGVFSEELQFEAVFTVQTLLVVAVVAVAIGVVFGTYPASRAARLDPVTAIRRL